MDCPLDWGMAPTTEQSWQAWGTEQRHDGFTHQLLQRRSLAERLDMAP